MGGMGIFRVAWPPGGIVETLNKGSAETVMVQLPDQIVKGDKRILTGGRRCRMRSRASQGSIAATAVGGKGVAQPLSARPRDRQTIGAVLAERGLLLVAST
jgi:glutathione synthase/RimK-type ligase-like ATP-grasp enzyme